jgi:uncharacterized protein (TIGR01244 family)
MKSWIASAVLIAVPLAAHDAAAASCPVTVDPALIVNYRVVKPGLATAGRVSAEGLAQLKALGFKTVLNLRTEQEGAKDEEAAVRAQGLRYEWVPVTPDSLAIEDVKKVESILDDPAAEPILFHCASANRVGAVWAIIQVRHGKELAAAIEEGRQIGLKDGPMTAAVERLVGSSGATRPK